MGDITPRFNSEIFRTDHPIILACDRHLATLIPVIVKFPTTGFVAGTVLGRNTSTTYYEAYSSGGSNGLDTAAGVLLEDVVSPDGATGLQAKPLCVGGRVYKDKLTGLDAGAIGDLGARTVVDSLGNNILIF